MRHTSAEQMGQVFIPQINLLLMVGVILIVIAFGTSASLASAYGIAVTARW